MFWLGAKGDTPKVRAAFEREKHRGPNLTVEQFRMLYGWQSWRRGEPAPAIDYSKLVRWG